MSHDETPKPLAVASDARREQAHRIARNLDNYRAVLRGAPIAHGYRHAGEAIAESRRQTIKRPTETDAIISMITGKTHLGFSDKRNNFTGTDTKAYTKPAASEKAVMFERGYKWCPGTDSTHAPMYISLMDFWSNRARKDNYDNLCKHCRIVWNGKTSQRAA